MIRMSAKVIIAFYAISVLGCRGTSSLSKSLDDKLHVAIREYPAWFWNTPANESEILSVGYSETYYREESSKEQALKNGTENLAKSISVRIKSEQGFWSIGSQMAIADNFEEAIDDEILRRVKDNYKTLHTYKADSMTIVLLSFGETSSLDKGPNGATRMTELKPKWLKELPQTRGHLYAIGSSSSYFRETQSWLTAEKNARIALASTLGIKLQSLIRQLDQYIEIVQAVEVNVELNKTQILSRWVDLKAGIYHVLARMPLDRNKDAAINQLNAMIALSKSVIKKKEEVIERTYKELEEEINSLEETR